MTLELLDTMEFGLSSTQEPVPPVAVDWTPMISIVMMVMLVGIMRSMTGGLEESS